MYYWYRSLGSILFIPLILSYTESVDIIVLSGHSGLKACAAYIASKNDDILYVCTNDTTKM